MSRCKKVGVVGLGVKNVGGARVHCPLCKENGTKYVGFADTNQLTCLGAQGAFCVVRSSFGTQNHGAVEYRSIQLGLDLCAVEFH